MATYYIDGDAGSDGDGSIGSPWNTFAHIDDDMVAGDILEMRGNVGSYQVYDEPLYVSINGTAGSPIIIRPYSNEQVELHAGEYELIIHIAGAHVKIYGRAQLKIDGNEISRTYAIRVDGHYTGLYDAIVTNLDGGDTLIYVENADYCEIDGCTIYDAFGGNTQDAGGIYLQGAQYATISHNTIYDCRGDGIYLGLEEPRDCRGTKIHNNVIYTTLGQCSENGIDVKRGGVAGAWVEIYDNELYGFRACTATCGGTGDPRTPAIQVHDYSAYVRTYRNIIHDCIGGIYYEDEITSGEIYQNVIYDLKTAAEDPNAVTLTALAINATNIKIYNNTIEDAPEDSLVFWGVGDDPSNILRNNIFKDCGTIVNGGDVTADHNCWRNCTDTLAGVGDVTDDPLFVDEAGHDYNLDTGSPCIDAGVDVGLDYEGAAPDMGAFETTGGGEPPLGAFGMLLLKQSTATTIQMGPFVDATDGVTPETGLTISQADVRLSKNGAAYAQKNEASAATHNANGWYRCALNTTDTNTLGALQVAVYEAGALPVWHEFMVVPANVYDSLVSGTDYLQGDTVQIEGGDATNALTAAAPTVDDIWDEVLEGTLTGRQLLRVLLAALAGKSTGGGTVTVTFRDRGDTKARITATVDVNGNRTAMTVDGT